jgi:hypothetical protein
VAVACFREERGIRELRARPPALPWHPHVHCSCARATWVPGGPSGGRNRGSVAVYRSANSGTTRIGCWTKVRNVSTTGSQFKSFGFNAHPTEHASCRAAPTPGLKNRITHPYPNFPILICWGTPRIPPVLREHSVQRRARPIAPKPRGLVGRAVLPHWGPTWAKCARTVAQRTRTREMVVEAGFGAGRPNPPPRDAP